MIRRPPQVTRTHTPFPYTTLVRAALSPAAYSMLSDTFPRDRLARAMAVYSIGVPLGSGVALILGSFVVQAVLAAPMVDLPLIGPVEAWRTIFLWVAAPGLQIGRAHV